MCESLSFQLGFQYTVECQVPGEKCAVVDPRSWLSGPCCPSQLLSVTPPEQTLHSVPVMFWWRNSQCPGLGWRSSDVGRSLRAALSGRASWRRNVLEGRCRLRTPFGPGAAWQGGPGSGTWGLLRRRNLRPLSI